MVTYSTCSAFGIFEELVVRFLGKTEILHKNAMYIRILCRIAYNAKYYVLE